MQLPALPKVGCLMLAAGDFWAADLAAVATANGSSETRTIEQRCNVHASEICVKGQAAHLLNTLLKG